MSSKDWHFSCTDHLLLIFHAVNPQCVDLAFQHSFHNPLILQPGVSVRSVNFLPCVPKLSSTVRTVCCDRCCHHEWHYIITAPFSLFVCICSIVIHCHNAKGLPVSLCVVRWLEIGLPTLDFEWPGWGIGWMEWGDSWVLFLLSLQRTAVLDFGFIFPKQTNDQCGIDTDVDPLLVVWVHIFMLRLSCVVNACFQFLQRIFLRKMAVS